MWAGYKSAPAVQELEERFKNYLGVKYAFSFNAGRSAFYAILKTLDLEKESDVLLQAFTCNAVPNPILWAGLNPIYVDCGSDYNIDIEDLKRKLSKINQNYSSFPRKAGIVLIVQYTFGLPANINEILEITRQNNLIVIEDCAHALGAEYRDNSLTGSGPAGKVGTFGKAAFFSFSRDKVISCVYGGMAITNDDEIGKRLEQLQKEFGQPSLFWIKQQLLHPILLYYIIMPLYKFLDLGKLFLIFSQWLHLLSKAVSWKEKRGLKPDYFPRAMPNALAIMAINQLNKLSNFNNHRQKIADFYYEQLKNTQFILPQKNGNIFLRFAIQHPKAHEIIYEAWHNQNILLGDWYTTPIAPDDTKLSEMKYKNGSCPNAESLVKSTLNLPTHINISLDDARRITNFLKKYA
jgi:dTDP-4-amino-4,6-dideoxygalactose transaminase